MAGETMQPVALITGGRRGIGRGIALALARSGFDIVINDLVEDEVAAETVAAIAALGRRAAIVVGDIADIAGLDRMAGAAWERFGAIDCLVNNAGVSVMSRGDLLDVSLESYDRCLDINLRGPFFLTQKIARRMLEAPAMGQRSIITISSVSSEVVSVARGEYFISKAGLSMMSKLFAARLAESGIAVFEVRPGIIRTDMTRPSAERLDQLIAEGFTPIRRWGEPDDVGRAVATLACGGLPFSVGQVIHVDGGLTLRTL